MSNKLTDLAIEVLLVEKDIPLRIDYSKEDPLYRFNINDFSVYIFEQTWGSTALGFGGMGGQAMTTANTIVLVPNNCHQDCFVYFAGRFAYSVPYSNTFGDDVKNFRMASVNGMSKYLGNNREKKPDDIEEEFEVCENCGQIDCRARDLIPPEKQPFEPCDSWIPKCTN